ncbi:sensor histidine kinase [Alkalihalobacillus hwajinpoensis]|uniref:sensor histidine kinase n=1 Tax=Guptibacillus hwajinpoensis TaxID=208199 RepID=UPI0018841046|nr:sensor histidine kinase [Pseudalkalibacillus hwajinpoensis]MBF0706042.1 sensor histidine kinase [Pseudalkalibacillus hwajinpoensis]
MIKQLMHHLFYKKSIKVQLFFVFVLLNIIIILLFGYISYKVSTAAMLEEAEKNNKQILEIISKNINTYYEDVEQELDDICKIFNKNDITSISDRTEKNDLSFLKEKIRNTIDIKHAFFDSVRVFDDQSELVITIENPNKEGSFSYNSQQEINWRKKMESNDANQMIYNVYQSDENGAFSFVSSKPIFDLDTGDRIGYISYSKSLPAFSSIFREYEYRKGSIVQVIRRDDSILYHSNHSLIGKQAEGYLLDKLKTSSIGSIKKKINQENILVSYNKLTSAGLSVVGFLPVTELERGINSLRVLTILLIFLACFLVFFFSYFLSTYFSKPIRNLSDSMQKVENEDFSVRIKDKNTNTEIDQLNASFNSMVQKINDLIQKQYKTEILKRDVELKALLVQINPHFLYNTLEVISGIAATNEVEQIEDITDSLSRMLRYNIDLHEDQVMLKEEVNYCNSYLSIMKSRYEDQISFTVAIDQKVENFIVPKMILQPLLENAIKYSVEQNQKQASIHLSIGMAENLINIIIEDNGIGFNSIKRKAFETFQMKPSIQFEEVTKINHLGLKNVYARLKMNYGRGLGFTIDSTMENGTRICITFPALKRQMDVGEK